MNPYPYKILPVVCPSLQATLKLDPSFVLEFFRIEALLRSPTVIKLYETTFSSWDRSSKENHHRTDTLRNKYNIIGGWQVLDGVHHEFHLHQTHAEFREMTESYPDPEGEDIAHGIVNVGIPMVKSPEVFDEWVNAFRDPTTVWKGQKSRTLWLAIDPARSPQAVLDDLRPFLIKQHKQYKRNKHKVQGFFLVPPWPHWDSLPYEDPHRPLPIRGYKGITTWLNYLRCYDLKVCDGLTPSPIAQRVYPVQYAENKRKATELATQGIRRVKRLIAAAESDNWPAWNL